MLWSMKHPATWPVIGLSELIKEMFSDETGYIMAQFICRVKNCMS